MFSTTKALCTCMLSITTEDHFNSSLSLLKAKITKVYRNALTVDVFEQSHVPVNIKILAKLYCTYTSHKTIHVSIIRLVGLNRLITLSAKL